MVRTGADRSGCSTGSEAGAGDFAPELFFADDPGFPGSLLIAVISHSIRELHPFREKLRYPSKRSQPIVNEIPTGQGSSAAPSCSELVASLPVLRRSVARHHACDRQCH